MSTDQTLLIVSESSAATEAFGRQLGQRLKGQEVIELVSDLGGGKTTLTRGIAKGAGSQDIVSSPTFTLSKVYKTPSLAMYHFDFYRLEEPGLMAHELHDAMADPDGVVLVEWGEIVQDVLPKARATITISKTADDRRELKCQYPKSLEYLFV